MKHLKMLGLVTIAAMAVMAFFDVGTASATVLCETDEVYACETAWDVQNGTLLTFSAEGSTVFRGPSGEIVSTCTGSTLSGRTTSTGSSTSTVQFVFESIGFTGCSRTITTLAAGKETLGTLEVHATTGGNGVVTVNDTTLVIDNTAHGNCSFLASNAKLGTLTGHIRTGGAPTLVVAAQLPSENCSGFPVTWEASYEYTGTTNFSVATGSASSSGAAVFCEGPATGDCTSPVTKGTNLVFSAENSITLTGPFGEIIAKCTKSTVEGPIGDTGSTTEPVWANISKLTFEECPERTVLVNSGTKGTLEARHIASTDNSTVISDDTTVTIEGAPFFGTCRYLTSNTSIGTLTGRSKTGGHPTFDINATIPSENGCPNGTWEGSYEYKGTTDFDVTGGTGATVGKVGTTLCEETPAGDCTSPVTKGTNLAFSAENSITLTGPFGEIIAKCTKSTMEGATGNTGSTTESVWGNISALTFEECPERTVMVNSEAAGTLEVRHISGTDNGTVTSTNTTVTIEKVPLFGTCRYLTSNTDIGTLTGKSKTGGHPTFDINASIPSENGCPTGTWEGSYEYKGATDFDVAGG